MMQDVSSVIRSVCEEKNLDYDAVVEAVEYALAAAYRKDYGNKNQNIKVDFKPETGDMKITDVKTVVEDLPEEESDEEVKETKKEEEEKKDDKKEDVKTEKEKEKKEEENEEEEEEKKKFNPKTEIQLSDAKLIKKDAKVGDELVMELESPNDFGRMASQTAKQVIIQKIREIEREIIYNEFKEKEHEVVNGTVQRREGRSILIDLANASGYLPAEEQVPRERYIPGDRIKVFIKSVTLEPKGPRITLSRTSEEIVKTLFFVEIPELSNGTIELKAIARIPGSRSKIAVWTEVENVDPIGSCIGQKGARIQTIIRELNGEKIDVIEYDDDISKYISNSLSPARVVGVEITNEEAKEAIIHVEDDQFSLAIGKRGENIKLASQLTGWNLKIKPEGSEELISSDKEEREIIKEKEKIEGKEGEGATEEASSGEPADDEKEVKKEKEEKGSKKENENTEEAKEEKDEKENKEEKGEKEDKKKESKKEEESEKEKSE